jgi:hypothetical protein
MAVGVCLGALALAPACKQTVLFEEMTDGPVISGGGGNGGNGGNNGGGDGSAPPFCTGGGSLVNLHPVPRSAEVIIALDRSNGMTMNSDFGASSSFTAAQTQLEAVVPQYVFALGTSVLLFPSPSFACGSGSGMDPDCCTSDAPAPNSSPGAFPLQLHSCDQANPPCPAGTEHAMKAALESCRSFYQNEPPSISVRQRYVLVLTNGAPSGCFGNNSDCNNSFNEVSALANNNGVKTMFIWLNPPGSDQNCISQLASASANSSASATTQQDIQTALTNFLGRMAKAVCQIDVTSPPSNPNNVSLFDSAGNPIPKDDTIGWDWSFQGQFTKITLHGDACNNAISEGPGNLTLVECVPGPGHP